MSSESIHPSEREKRFQEVLAAYLQAVETGQAPDRQEWLARHPDLADELASFFANQEHFARRAEPLQLVEEPTLPPGPAPTAQDDLGTVRYFGDYELLAEIARGGMGVVCKARQVSLNRIVALKMILAGQLASPADVQRFRAEAEAAANLDHSNIVPIYEVGEHEGQHYFSMKLVEGVSLAQAISRKGAKAQRPDEADASTLRSLRLCARLMEQVARAVHYAHQRGILHRDLKPANILLDAQGQPHVTDFGLARRIEAGAGLTQSGAIVGTPSYMPPEQARAEKGLTTAADVYSLGAILYELLTGRPPFRAETQFDTLMQVLEKDAVRPRALQPQVDRDLETICLKCLEKEPQGRYPSAEVLAEDLDRWLRGEPINARRSGVWERARKWVRRRPAAAALLAVSAVAVAGLAVLIGALWYNAEQRARAVQKLDQAEEALDAKREEIQELELKAGEERRHLAEAQDTARRTLYAADMQMAQAAWEANDLRRVVSLLDRQRPRSGQEDLRGFEWYYLWRLFHSQRRTLRLSADAKSVETIAFSPDGTLLAMVDGGETLRLWEAGTGRERFALEHRISFNVKIGQRPLFAFAPSSRVLAFPTTEDVPAKLGKIGLRLLDPLSGRETGTLGLPDRDPDHILALAYASRGRVLVAYPERDELTPIPPKDGIRVWDAAAGKEQVILKGKEEFYVLLFTFSPDGTTAAAAGLHTNVDLDKMADEDLDKLFGAGKAPGAILVWDMATGQEKAFLKGHPGMVLALAFSPDGKAIASRSHDGTVKLWDLALRRERWTVTVPVSGTRQPDEEELAFAPDGKTLASANFDGTVTLWDTATGQVRTIMKGHLDRVKCLAFAPDGKTLASGSADGTVKLWDPTMAQGPLLQARLKHPKDRPVLSPDGKRLALWSKNDQSVKVLDAVTGREQLRLQGGKDESAALAFAPDSKTLAIQGLDRMVRLWDTNTGKERLVLKVAFDSIHLLFSSDGKILATTGLSVRSEVGEVPRVWFCAVELWDTASARKLWTLEAQRHALSSLAVSPSGQTFAAGTGDGTVRLWDVGTGQEQVSLKGHDDAVSALAFSSNGRILAAGGTDGKVVVWDMATRRQLAICTGHTGGIALLAFTPDGRTLACASADMSVKLWDVVAGLERFTLMHEGRMAEALWFTPDGKELFVLWSWTLRGVQPAELLRYRAATEQEVAAAKSP
jgi:WD40 repeat protein/tRNA A-37 threonylcarbamoyl transferase component Bud32